VGRTAATPGDTHAMVAVQGSRWLSEQDLQDAPEEVDVAGPGPRHARPEAACAKAFGDGERYSADQGQHQHLSAANVEQRLPNIEHVAARAGGGGARRPPR